MSPLNHSHHNFPARLFILAGFCLALALAVYCLGRSQPPELIPSFLLMHGELFAFGGIGGSAPSFLYTLALGLFIGACAASRESGIFHCLAWTALCLVLEISQQRDVASYISARLGELLPASSMQPISTYWERGVYDTNDLLATLVGGLLATVLIAHTGRKRRNAHV